MSVALKDLIFWIVLFVVIFYGFKWLQKRNKKHGVDKKSSRGPTKDDT